MVKTVIEPLQQGIRQMEKRLNVIASAGSAQQHIHPAEITKEISHKDTEGLRVVFINMPLRETSRPTATPEGPLLMATNLRQNYGVDATIIDLNAYRIQDDVAKQRGLVNGRHLTYHESSQLIQLHFEAHGIPDMVGLSGMITTLGASDGRNVAKQQETAKIVRSLAPNTLLVSGGGLATELKTGLFNYIPELDAVAHSEGDDVIIKICYDAMLIKRYGWESAVSQGKLRPYYLGQINGRHRLMYAGDRPASDKKGILPESLPFADLELIKRDVYGWPVLDWYLNVPAWSANSGTSSATPWKDEDLVPKYNSVSSRGCPFKCHYCYRGAQGETLWGVRSAEHLYQEAVHNRDKYGIKFIVFPDDNFAVAIPRIESMVPLFKPLRIPWGTHTRMDEGADPKRIKPMADAGCVYIGFGPESAHPVTLEAIGKGGQTLTMGFEAGKINGKVYQFPRSMTMSMRNCLNYGVHANCTWIAGSPGETLEHLQQTVAFMLWQERLYDLSNIPSGAVNTRMFSMTWYPGTKLIQHPKVRHELNRVFGLNFDPVTMEPICDDAFYLYCLELDDATKVLEGTSGEPLNFSNMDTDTFLKVREYVDSGNTLGILDL